MNLFSFNTSVKAQGAGTKPIMNLYLLDQAINIAVKDNPTLQAEIAKTGISKSQLTTINTLSNPYFIAQQSIGQQQYSYGLERTWQTGGGRKYSKRIAIITNDIDLLELQKQTLEIRQQARKAYIDHFSNQEKLRIEQEIYSVGRKIVDDDIKTKKFSNPNIFLAEEVLLSIANDIQTLKVEIIKSKTNLEEITGKNLDKEITLLAPKEIPLALKNIMGQELSSKSDEKIEKLTQMAMEKRPLELEANKNIELWENERKLALADRFPIVILAAGAVLDFNAKLYGPFINANIELPIFELHKDRIQQADSQLDYYKKQKTSVENQITYQVKGAYNTLVANKERINNYETQLLPKAEEIRKGSLNSYKKGATTVDNPLSAQRTYIDTKIAYLQAVADYQESITVMERVLGVGL